MSSATVRRVLLYSREKKNYQVIFWLKTVTDSLLPYQGAGDPSQSTPHPAVRTFLYRPVSTFYCRGPSNHHVFLTITRLPTLGHDSWLVLLFFLPGSLLLHLSLAHSSSCFKAHLRRLSFWGHQPQWTSSPLLQISVVAALGTISLGDSAATRTTVSLAFSLCFPHLCLGMPPKVIFRCFTK